jgi:hypothetical protein
VSQRGVLKAGPLARIVIEKQITSIFSPIKLYKSMLESSETTLELLALLALIPKLLYAEDQLQLHPLVEQH